MLEDDRHAHAAAGLDLVVGVEERQVQASRYRADVESDVVFWRPSPRAWRRMLWTAGFDRVAENGRFTLDSSWGFGVRHVVLHGWKS